MRLIFILNSFSFVLISLLAFFLISCNPDEDDILGLDLIQDDEFVIEKRSFPNDSIPIPIHTFQEDSVSGFSPYNLLGSFRDDYFGQSNASFFTQILLPNSNIDFDHDPNTDIKVELSLPYYKAYGNSSEPITVSVFEVTESLASLDTSAAFLSESYEYNSSPLAQTTFSANDISDSIDWNGSNVSPRLIINLSDSDLGNKLLNGTEDNLANNDNFLEFFNGLFLQATEQDNGSIIYFNTTSSNCFLRVTYTKKDQTESIVEFPVGGAANRHNYFTHNYSNSKVFDYLGDDNTYKFFVFLQSMGGIAAELDLSFLTNPLYADWIINKASLNIPIYEDAQYNLFGAPAYLVLAEYDNNEILAIEDLAGGLYNEVSNNYSFSIGKHIQKIISNEHNASLRLYVGGKISNAERLIIDNHSDNGINLELHIIDN